MTMHVLITLGSLSSTKEGFWERAALAFNITLEAILWDVQHVCPHVIKISLLVTLHVTNVNQPFPFFHSHMGRALE